MTFKKFKEFKELCKVESHQVGLARQRWGIEVLQAYEENNKIYKDTDYLPWDTKFCNTLLFIFIGILWETIMNYFHLSKYWYILLIVAIFIWAINIIPMLFFAIKFRKEKPWQNDIMSKKQQNQEGKQR